MRKKILTQILMLFFIFKMDGVLHSQNQAFNLFLDLFRIDTLPFNSVSINENTNFFEHKEKYKIPRQYVIKYLIKDTSELWHRELGESTTHEGELELYSVETDFYTYCRFSIFLNFYPIVYYKEIPEKSAFYLKIFNKSGSKILVFQLTGADRETHFYESEINTDLSIKRVTYTYVEDKKSRIDIETYSLDTTANNYKLINKMTNYTSHNYYDYVEHKLEDDPFRIEKKK